MCLARDYVLNLGCLENNTVSIFNPLYQERTMQKYIFFWNKTPFFNKGNYFLSQFHFLFDLNVSSVIYVVE